VKTYTAIFPDRFTAWNVITEISRSHIVPRHDMKIEPVDGGDPDGRTRITVATKMPHEDKDAAKLIRKYKPTEFTDQRGKKL
jgi:hypothetical protein